MWVQKTSVNWWTRYRKCHPFPRKLLHLKTRSIIFYYSVSTLCSCLASKKLDLQYEDQISVIV
jgi:hypothetical protein